MCENMCKLCRLRHHRQPCPRCLELFNIDDVAEKKKVSARLDKELELVQARIKDRRADMVATRILGRQYEITFDDRIAAAEAAEAAAASASTSSAQEGPVLALFAAKFQAPRSYGKIFPVWAGLTPQAKLDFKGLLKKQVQRKVVIVGGDLYNAMRNYLRELPAGFTEVSFEDFEEQSRAHKEAKEAKDAKREDVEMEV